MKNQKRDREERPIDETAESVYSWWKKSFVMIKKTRIRTWKGVFILAFVAGVAVAIVWSVSINIQTSSRAAGETSRLILDTTSQHIVKGDSFDVDVVIDTNNANVVAVRAIVDYNPANFTLTSWDTTNSTFSVNNTCVFNSKPCEIVTEDAESGMIEIVMAKPSPGVKTDSGKIATLTFQAIGDVQTTDNIEINFKGVRNSTDSDMILDGIGDGGAGTDILAEVVNTTINIVSAICTDFIFTEWTDCQPDGTQTREITLATPEGCAGGDPVITQTCTYVPPVCTSFEYSDWTVCQPNNTQSRTVTTSIPEGCSGGVEPELTQSCQYNGKGGDCISFEYSDWTACQPNNTQSRTVTTSNPEDCSGGVEPILSQSCTYGGSECVSFNYSGWSECRSDNLKVRTIASRNPVNCTGGVTPSLIDNCEFVDDSDDDFVDEVDSGPIEVDTPTLKIKSSKDKIKLSKNKRAYTKEKKLTFKGEISSLAGGKVQVFVDKKIKKEIKIKSDGKWKDSVKMKNNGTYTIQFKYVDKNGSIVDTSSKYKIRVDTKKPKFTDLPLFLNKQPGDLIWWRATDNNKIKYYKYHFNGRVRETKKDSFVVPADTPPGIHNLEVRVYDKSGNRERRWVVVRVR